MSVSQLLLLQPTCLEVARHTLYQKKNHNLASGKWLSACFETPAVIGPCKAAFPRWTFENGVCRKFIYGGCTDPEGTGSTLGAQSHNGIFHAHSLI